MLNFFKRIRISDFSFDRAFMFIKRRLTDFGINIIYKFDKLNIDNIKKQKNIYKNQKVYLLANGPSLSNVNFNFLKNKITIGLNRAYLLKKNYGFEPNYLVVVNDLVMEQWINDFVLFSGVLIVPYKYKKKLSKRKNKTLFFNTSLALNDKFSRDFSKRVYTGGTVTYVAMQLAFYFGVKDLVLLGLDHSFAEKGKANKEEIRSYAFDKSHFDKNYFPKGSKWQLPDLLRSELAYEMAKKNFESVNSLIIDATLLGKCDVFKKKILKHLYEK